MCRPRTNWNFLGVLTACVAVHAVWAAAVWVWIIGPWFQG